MLVEWNIFKSFIDERSLSTQWVDLGSKYWLKAFDGNFYLECIIVKDLPDTTDQSDFETNYKDNGNESPNSLVTTQYEKNDKDLKLCKVFANVVAGSIGTPSKAEIRLKVPGTFGDPNSGRYIAGGDGWTDIYDKDDYVKVECYDDDRLISAAYGGLTDEQMQEQGDFPNYPLIKTYTDEDLEEENQGWYFWQLAQGSTLDPVGEVEFESIAGYGHVPAGLYLVITLIRPSLSTGYLRGNLFWGKKE